MKKTGQAKKCHNKRGVTLSGVTISGGHCICIHTLKCLYCNINRPVILTNFLQNEELVSMAGMLSGNTCVKRVNATTVLFIDRNVLQNI